MFSRSTNIKTIITDKLTCKDFFATWAALFWRILASFFKIAVVLTHTVISANCCRKGSSFSPISCVCTHINVLTSKKQTMPDRDNRENHHLNATLTLFLVNHGEYDAVILGKNVSHLQTNFHYGIRLKGHKSHP